MKTKLGLIVLTTLIALGCAPAFALPEFNYESYSVKQFFGEMFLIESEGRDFICNVETRKGVVEVKGCLLFATNSEMLIVNELEREAVLAADEAQRVNIAAAMDARSRALDTLIEVLGKKPDCEARFGSKTSLDANLVSEFGAVANQSGLLKTDQIESMLVFAVDSMFSEGKLSLTDSSTKIKLTDCP